ncbi:MAG TPA: OmpH family outer membrane protein [Phycisphaerae bacterium]|nr:OmpH family outer membrane protein [Phycisphaerae bacterium]
MRPTTKLLLTTPALILIAALSLGQTATPAPRVLAVININKVFSSLNEKIDGDASIKQMADQFQADQQKREQELEKIAGQLRDDTLFKTDSPEYRNLQDKALQMKSEYDANANMAQQKLLIEQRLKTIQIYRRMNDAIKQYAESKGIGLVLVADDINFDAAQTIEGVTQRIANRKVIYAHPDYDITQQIIEKMNADYKLGNK